MTSRAGSGGGRTCQHGSITLRTLGRYGRANCPDCGHNVSLKAWLLGPGRDLKNANKVLSVLKIANEYALFPQDPR